MPAVPAFTIFNERDPVFIWSLAHVNVAPLVPASAVHNDGLPLSNPLAEPRRFVELSGDTEKSSQ
jgi:hypothetical protein